MCPITKSEGGKPKKWKKHDKLTSLKLCIINKSFTHSHKYQKNGKS
jgi:hypothetical protein